MSELFVFSICPVAGLASLQLIPCGPGPVPRNGSIFWSPLQQSSSFKQLSLSKLVNSVDLLYYIIKPQIKIYKNLVFLMKREGNIVHTHARAHLAPQIGTLHARVCLVKKKYRRSGKYILCCED